LYKYWVVGCLTRGIAYRYLYQSTNCIWVKQWINILRNSYSLCETFMILSSDPIYCIVQFSHIFPMNPLTINQVYNDRQSYILNIYFFTLS
jgi:hypothetical protein